jgi:hypothetical protein
MSDLDKTKLAQYIADYVQEELMRGNNIDVWVIKNAIEAYEGGAAESN